MKFIWSWLRAFALFGFSLLVMGATLQAAPAPFVCDGTPYTVINDPSMLQYVDRSDLSVNDIGILEQDGTNTQKYVNGIGYNILDNYIYAMDSNTRDIVRVGSDQNITYLGNPTPTSGAHAWNKILFYIGTMDSDGKFYGIGDGYLYIVNIGTNPGAGTLTYTTKPLSGTVGYPADITFNVTNGKVYGTRGGALYEFDITSGNVSTITVNPHDIGDINDKLPSNAGGAWSTSKGELYFYSNQDGTLTKVEILPDGTGTVDYVGDVTPNGKFDATACRPPYITKEASTKNIVPGGTYSYQFVIYNPFTKPIDVNFTDVLPSALTYDTANLSTLVASDGSDPDETLVELNATHLLIDDITLPINGYVEFNVSVIVDPNVNSQSDIVNTAFIHYGVNTSPSDDPDTGTPGDDTTVHVNIAPTANDDSAVTDEDTPVVIDVDANDTDPGNDLNLSSIEVTVAPVNGTFNINTTTGDITYTPNANYYGTDTFTYKICDNGMPVLCDEANVTVTILVQDMGTIAGIVYEDIDGDGIQDADEPGVKDVNVTITDNRGKVYQLLTDENGLYSQGVPAGSTTIVIDESPYESIIQTQGTNPTTLDVPSGGIINDVDGYRAALGRLVRGTPRPPVVGEDNATGITNSATIIDVVGNDTPGTYPLDPTTVRIIDPVNGEVMTMTVPGEGIWSVDPATGEITFTPVSGFVGDPTSIEYTVYDTNGAQSAYATINIDYPPVANDDEAHATVEGETVTIDILQNDQNTSLALDPESVSLVVPDNATDIVTDGAGDIIGFIVPDEGEWSVDEDTGVVTFVPDEDQLGDPTPVRYTVKETNGAISNEAIIEIFNPAPTASAGPVATDNLNVPITSYNPTVIDVFANGDTYGVNGPGTVEMKFTQPAHGSVVLDDGGTPNDPTDDVLIYTPVADVNNITDSFTYTITDAQGNTSTATVTLNVNCASSQTSDGGNALGTLSMMMMIFLTVMSGLYFVRKEEERGEA